MVIESMASQGKEPTFCMGDDIPLAALSQKPHMLFDYFKQRFAQVNQITFLQIILESNFLGIVTMIFYDSAKSLIWLVDDHVLLLNVLYFVHNVMQYITLLFVCTLWYSLYVSIKGLFISLYCSYMLGIFSKNLEILIERNKKKEHDFIERTRIG